MRSLAIVIGDPCRDFGPCLIGIEEQRIVQELVAHPAVPNEAVLHRFARCGEVPIDAGFLAPGQHGVTGQFGAVVIDDQAGFVAQRDNRRQFQPTRR